MEIDKTRWRELGLTPRQLSKKVGVTYSMAKFITQSYRIPVHTQCPVMSCARSPLRHQKCPKKKQCTCTLTWKGGCDEVPGFAAPSASSSRKRERSDEELSDCEHPSTSYAYTKTKEVYETMAPPCLSPRRKGGDHNSCKTCAFCRQKNEKTSSFTKAKCSRGKKGSHLRRSKTTRAKNNSSFKCNCTAQPCKKKRRVFPVNIHLDVPLNIFLDDDEGVELDYETQQCEKRESKSTVAQVPSHQSESICEHPDDECQRTEEKAKPWSEETEDEEDPEMEKCVPHEDHSSESDICTMTQSKEEWQTSWWEKIRECMVFLETLLTSLINKC